MLRSACRQGWACSMRLVFLSANILTYWRCFVVSENRPVAQGAHTTKHMAVRNDTRRHPCGLLDTAIPPMSHGTRPLILWDIFFTHHQLSLKEFEVHRGISTGNPSSSSGFWAFIQSCAHVTGLRLRLRLVKTKTQSQAPWSKTFGILYEGLLQ